MGRYVWVRLQCIWSLGIGVAITANLLTVAARWGIGIEEPTAASRALWFALVVVLNVWPGVPLQRLWMRAHGYWQ